MTRIKWGFSALDMTWHAVDEAAEHSEFFYGADCGLQMLRSTTLHDDVCGRPCEKCSTIRLDRVELAQQTEEEGGDMCPDGANQTTDGCTHPNPD